MIKQLLNIQKEIDEMDDSEDESLDFNEEEVRGNLPEYTSEKLADLIITYRYIGLYKELSISAMEELSKRRTAGDSFEFESYIDKELKELPALNFNIKDLDIFQVFRGFKNAK